MLALVFVALGWAEAASANRYLEARLERNRIYEGESVLYEVTIRGLDTDKTPDVSEFDKDFEVRYLGAPSQVRSRSVRIIGGKAIQESLSTITHRFELTPRRHGRFETPAPVLEIAGRTLVGETFLLEVIPADQQDVVDADIVIEPSKAYPMQRFRVTLRVRVKQLPEPFADSSPINRVILEVPWANDQAAPAGVRPVDALEDWLGRIPTDYRGGFVLRGIARAHFLLDYEVIERPDANGRPALYREYSLSRDFVAEKIGEATFGPVRIKGIFNRDWKRAEGRRGKFETELVGTEAPAASVRLETAPLEGRPDSFTGAIGRFELDAEIDPTKAFVGDPLELRLIVRGEGLLAGVAPPDLEAIADMTKAFRVYEASARNEKDARIFSYQIRPLRPGSIETPAIPFSYFDPYEEQYVTLSTEPMQLAIDAATGAGVTATISSSESATDVEIAPGGVFVNLADPALVVDQSIEPSRWFAALGGLAMAYAGIATGSVWLRARLADEVGRRRRGAVSRARGRLREAFQRMEQGDVRAGAEKLHGALAGLVADVADVPEEGLTAREAGDRLSFLDVDPAVRDRVVMALEATDGARFGPVAGAGTGLENDAEQTLGVLVDDLKRKGLLR